MKRCPTCNRTFSDESISFCLVDGAVLSPPFELGGVGEESPSDLYPTIPSLGLPINLERQNSAAPLKRRDRRLWIISIVLLIIALAIGIFTLVRVRNEGTAPSESNKHNVRVSSEQWKLRATLSGHSGSVVSIAFSPDKQTLASATNGESVKIWNIVTGEVKRELTSPAQIHSVVFSPSGNVLVGVGFRDTGKKRNGLNTMADVGLRMWDTRTNKPPRLINTSTFILSAAFSADGRTIATGGCGRDCEKGGELIIWDAENGKPKAVLKGHSQAVLTVLFSPDNKMIASGSADKTIKLWDVQGGALIRTLTGPTDMIKSVSFSPDGKLVACASDDKSVRVWDVQSGEMKVTLENADQSLGSVAFSPDGTTIAVGSGIKENSGQILLWDVRTWTLRLTLSGHKDRVRTIAFAADGKTLASGSEDKTVKLWERN